MALPTEKTKPKTNFWEYPIFLYGAPKIGKSTLLAELPNALFLNAGGGLDAIECFQVPLGTWEDYLEAGKEVLTTQNNYGPIVIDTIDRLHKLAVGFVCNRQNIVHPTDLGYGKGYDMVKDELMRTVTRLALSGKGLVLISHVRETEIQARTEKYTKAVPTLQSYIWELIDGLTAIVLYMTMETAEDGSERRVIYTTPSKYYIAGDRTNKLRKLQKIIIEQDGKNWERIQEAFAKDV